MRASIRWSIAALAAFAVTVASSEPSFARGGGPGGGGGGKAGGGGGGSPKGGSKGGTKGAKNGMKAKSAADYLDLAQREDAETQLTAFLRDARYDCLVNTASDDRDAALRAGRDKASADRREETESGAHPL